MTRRKWFICRMALIYILFWELRSMVFCHCRATSETTMGVFCSHVRYYDAFYLASGVFVAPWLFVIVLKYGSLLNSWSEQELYRVVFSSAGCERMRESSHKLYAKGPNDIEIIAQIRPYSTAYLPAKDLYFEDLMEDGVKLQTKKHSRD